MKITLEEIHRSLILGNCYMDMVQALFDEQALTIYEHEGYYISHDRKSNEFVLEYRRESSYCGVILKEKSLHTFFEQVLKHFDYQTG